VDVDGAHEGLQAALHGHALLVELALAHVGESATGGFEEVGGSVMPF
jgi:hypothetical protein